MLDEILEGLIDFDEFVGTTQDATSSCQIRKAPLVVCFSRRKLQEPQSSFGLYFTRSNRLSQAVVGDNHMFCQVAEGNVDERGHAHIDSNQVGHEAVDGFQGPHRHFLSFRQNSLYTRAKAFSSPFKVFEHIGSFIGDGMTPLSIDEVLLSQVESLFPGLQDPPNFSKFVSRIAFQFLQSLLSLLLVRQFLGRRLQLLSQRLVLFFAAGDRILGCLDFRIQGTDFASQVSCGTQEDAMFFSSTI